MLTPFPSKLETAIYEYHCTPSEWRTAYSVLEYLEEEQEFRDQFVAEARSLLGRLDKEEDFSAEVRDELEDYYYCPDEDYDGPKDYSSDEDYDGWNLYWSELRAYRSSEAYRSSRNQFNYYSDSHGYF